MKILIFLFAIITFVLMTSDPRNNQLNTEDSSWQNNQANDNLNNAKIKEIKDSDESV